MNKLRTIENILKKNEIKKYKIISKYEKSLLYTNVFGKENQCNTEFNKIKVTYLKNNLINEFTVSNVDESLIDGIVKKSLSSISDKFYSWTDNIPHPHNQKLLFKKEFDEFDFNEKIKKIKKELELLKSKIDFKVNFVFNFKTYRFELSTDKGSTHQYYFYSDGLCIENNQFQKKVNLKNILQENKLAEFILKKINIPTPPLKNIKIDFSVPTLIKKKAFAEILNTYIQNFYADNILSKKSFIKNLKKNKKISKVPFTIFEEAFDNILFDSEGFPVKNKNIIENGILKNILGNNKLSNKLNFACYGNSSLLNENHIFHQKIKFHFKESKPAKKIYPSITLLDFENSYINFENSSICGFITYIEQNHTYKSFIEIYFKDIFDNIYNIYTKNTWVDNVYCPDIIIYKNKK